MNKVYLLISITLVLLGVFGCDFLSEVEPGIPPDLNTIFGSTYEIAEVQSGTSTTPFFTWKATESKYIFLGVFNQPISVNPGEKRINNIDRCVWAWYSGNKLGRDGWVIFSDGVDVKNGELQIGTEPTPLISQKSYYWAIWAWDDSGKFITKSSREMYILVE